MIDSGSQQVRLRLYVGDSETPIDISPLFAGANGGDSHLLETGIISHAATLELTAYPLDENLLSGLGITTDPRSNPDIWAEGNIITIEIRNDANTDWILHKTLRISKPPQPPKPLQRPTLTIELTDYLGASIDNSGADDASEVELGTDTPKGSVVASLLSKVGLTTTTTIPGTINYPPQKLEPSGYLQQAGQVAYSSFRTLYCQADGTIDAQEISLDLPILGTYQIGQDERDFDALDTPFSPPFKVVCNSVAHDVQPLQDEYEITFTEQAPAIEIDPNADDEEFITVKSTTETGAWSGNQYQVVTTVNECASLVYPWWDGDPTTLVWSRTTTKTEIYSGGTEGELDREILQESRPLGAAMPVYVGGLDAETRDAVQGNSQTTILRVTDYGYSNGETESISSYTREPFGIVLPDETYTSPGITDLTTTESNKQEWTNLYEGAYRFRESPKKCVARAYPDLVQNLDTLDKKVRLVALETTTREANNGSTQPPAPRRRKPLRDWKQTPISGEAEFETQAGYQGVRERPYDIPYASEVSLPSHADFLGTRLWGEPLGISAQLPLRDEFKGDVPPIGRIRFIHPDGITREYLYHALVWEISQRESFVGLEGFYLGEAGGGNRPVKRLQKFVGATATGDQWTGQKRRVQNFVGAIAFGAEIAYTIEIQEFQAGLATGGQFSTVNEAFQIGTATGSQFRTTDEAFQGSLATGGQWVNPTVEVEAFQGGLATGSQWGISDERFQAGLATGGRIRSVDEAFQAGLAIGGQIRYVNERFQSGTATGGQWTDSALVSRFVFVGSGTTHGFGTVPSSLTTFTNPLASSAGANSVAVNQATGRVIVSGGNPGSLGRFARASITADLSNSANWTQFSVGTTPHDDFVVLDSSTWVVVATSGTNVRRSTDDGLNWSDVALPSAPSGSRAIGHNGSGKVLVASPSYAALSTNYGASFSAVTSPGLATTPEAVLWNNGRWFIGYGGGRIAYSDNDGSSWSIYVSGFGSNTFYSLFRVEGNVLLAASAAAASAGRVYRSTDNGDNWTDQGQVLGNRSIRHIDGTANSITVMATDGSFVQSADKGVTWGSVQSTGLTGLTKFAVQIS